MDSLEFKTKIKKPLWFKVKACGDKRYLEIRALLKKYNLKTVCSEANCPNRGECFSSGTATFLIMGPDCTRNCRFCNITHNAVAPLENSEPEHLARAVSILGLKYAVITSVTRDDLPDGGAGQFAKVIRAIKVRNKGVSVEVLTPDFGGSYKDVKTVLEAGPDVFNHNLETISRLYPQVRAGADYNRSLQVLKYAGGFSKMLTKSGLMVGLGESEEELEQAFHDLQTAGVKMLTIGQYLSPSKNHYPVQKYYTPPEFNNLAKKVRECGIKSVFSGPLVRSSYHAREQFNGQ